MVELQISPPHSLSSNKKNKNKLDIKFLLVVLLCLATEFNFLNGTEIEHKNSCTI